MTATIRDPDSLMSRAATARALTDDGYPIRSKTLATMATRGGGPPYHKWSKFVLYRWGDALQWAQTRLSVPHINTSARDDHGQKIRVNRDSTSLSH
jgi:hypothetical protein